MKNRILVVSAHPDDETLGCGGTILKHGRDGDDIFWLIVTNVSEELGYFAQKVKERQKEIFKVAAKYKFKKTFKLNFPTTGLDRVPMKDIINEIFKIFRQVKPEMIYLANRSDVHTDHQVIFNAVSACTKSFRFPFIRKILMYECISETEFASPRKDEIFAPNVFVDISDFIGKKIEIMKIYKSELGRHPFPRSIKNIKALATHRGAVMGAKYAEAFMLVREYIK